MGVGERAGVDKQAGIDSPAKACVDFVVCEAKRRMSDEARGSASVR
jgi:hypothetical protein